MEYYSSRLGSSNAECCCHRCCRLFLSLSLEFLEASADSLSVTIRYPRQPHLLPPPPPIPACRPSQLPHRRPSLACTS
ncbi:hypothetical protein CLOM_g5025 [Closterium sp. NIES-68]|nr:hypothetical protein CLOM_g5025 [Closterium sp. NIES-68]